MRHISRTKRLRQAAWVCSLGIVILAACAPGSARAQDDDDENSIWNLDKRMFHSLMGAIGLKDGSEPGIDYRERSPLVVPPTNNLPPPQAARTPHDPDWPVDPDQKRRREAARAKKNTPIYDSDYNERSLLPSELDPPKVRAARRGMKESTSTAPDSSDDHKLMPSQLGYFGGLFSWTGLGFGANKNEVGTFTHEPPRTSLSEPPSGYQTPSPAQPYGVTKRIEKGKAANPMDHAVGETGM
jgi:hypothetical protein